MKYLSLLLFLVVGCSTEYDCIKNPEKVEEYIMKCMEKCKHCNSRIAQSLWYVDCEASAF